MDDTDCFTYVRLAYSGMREVRPPIRLRTDWYGNGWRVDWPASDRNFIWQLSRAINIPVAPREAVVHVRSDEIFDYPFAYMLEVGSLELTDAEAKNLREYLLRGGFIMIDDFHGEREWRRFYRQFKKIFPKREPKDIPISHPLFHCFFDIDELIQIPGLAALFRGRTYERADGYPVRCRGVTDDHGRLMMMINFNTDLGDAWEHAAEPFYPRKYSDMAYRMGIPKTDGRGDFCTDTSLCGAKAASAHRCGVFVDPLTPLNPTTQGEHILAEQKATNITWHQATITQQDRECLLNQKGCVLWFTGLSGSGKSTLAHEVQNMLHERGHLTYVLDGDNIRHGLNQNLGFSPEDREENIRRIGEVSKLFADAGVIAITAFISPYIVDRDKVRALLTKGRFIEVFVDCPLEICEQRDTKGLYKKARAGEIKEFTGISAPYEAPAHPEIVVNTAELSLPQSADHVLCYLEESGLISISD